MTTIEELREQHLKKLQTINGVQLTCSPQYDSIPSGIEYRMPLLVQVIGGKLPESYSRDPINLCFVLDRSGSMCDCIEDCKQAMKSLIETLEPNDTLHFVVYDDSVDVVFSNKHSGDKQEMLELVNSVKVRGSTDLFAGIEKGIQLLQSSEATGTKLLFLFSDGLANQGIKDGETIGIKTKELCGGSVFVSTFGIGKDYDEKLMTSIAKSGSGNYYYIKHTETVPGLIRRAVASSTNFWSRNARLYIQGVGGSVVCEISGNSNILQGKSLKIREFAFHQYLVYAKCNPVTNLGEIQVTLNYTDNTNVDQQISVNSCWSAAENLIDFKPVENPFVCAHLTMLECSNLNVKLTEMMKERKPAEDVIRVKESIVKNYEKVLEYDEFCVLAPLLMKERETLNEFRTSGVYSKEASKIQDYNAGKAAGFSRQVYSYAEEEEESDDDDMGCGLFD